VCVIFDGDGAGGLFVFVDEGAVGGGEEEVQLFGRGGK